MHISLCVCMYMYISMHNYILTYIHTYTCIHVYIHADEWRKDQNVRHLSCQETVDKHEMTYVHTYIDACIYAILYANLFSMHSGHGAVRNVGVHMASHLASSSDLLLIMMRTLRLPWSRDTSTATTGDARERSRTLSTCSIERPVILCVYVCIHVQICMYMCIF
jgi:hypothetical protein